MTAFKRILFAITAISLFALCSTPEKEQAYLLIINAKIWTGNVQQPWADWVAVKDDKIMQVGSTTDAIPYAKEQIDAQGNLLLPGF
ncbi:MAG TPA: hypothetical protein PKC24_08370, partial [Cyclobacteriaceae bacterium]|nr:hypothetical protein [Cyclobacteriaceae bacterium]